MMTRTEKRFLWILLGLIVALALYCSAASAASSGTWGDLNWELDDEGLLTISGSGDMDPIDYWSNPEWLSSKDNILSVTITAGITSIGNNAFYECGNLESIHISDSVTSIGMEAFGYCYSLSSIDLPNSITDIGGSAFYGCTCLTSIELPESLKSIGDCVFYECRNLKNIYISDNVTSIGIEAFRDCSSLTSIELPNSITDIGGSAFYGCTSLTSIEFPESMKSIGDDFIFAGCSNLTIVTLPNSITHIGQRAFVDCNQLQTVIYRGTKDQAQAIDFSYGNGKLYTAAWTCDDGELSLPLSGTFQDLSWTFDQNKKELVISGSGEIPAKTESPWKVIHDLMQILRIEPGITCIGNDAFDESWQLRTIEISDTVNSIGIWAFWGCDNLTNVNIADGVTRIEDNAFGECGRLANTLDVFIPASVTYIDDSAFQKEYESDPLIITCYRNSYAHQYAKDHHISYKLLELLDPNILTLPASTTTIESEAFAGLTNVDIIVIPASVTSIADDAFAGSDVIIKAPSNSYAYRWAQSHGFQVQTP